MPVDVRKLIFSEREVREAFSALGVKAASQLAPAAIERVELVEPTKGKGLAANIYFASKDPKNPTRAHLDEHQILEALIGMCRTLKIPLPKRSKKYLQKHKNGVALTFGMSDDDIRIAHGT